MISQDLLESTRFYPDFVFLCLYSQQRPLSYHVFAQSNDTILELRSFQYLHSQLLKLRKLQHVNLFLQRDHINRELLNLRHPHRPQHLIFDWHILRLLDFFLSLLLLFLSHLLFRLHRILISFFGHFLPH